MASSRTKYSQHGQNRRMRVDMLALSPVARRQTVTKIPLGDFVQSATTKYSRGPMGFPGTLKAAYISFRTLPVGGVMAVVLKALSVSGSAEIALCSSFDPSTATVRQGSALTLAATNVALAAVDTLEIHQTADGTAVSQQQIDGYITLVFEKTEDTTISD